MKKQLRAIESTGAMKTEAAYKQVIHETLIFILLLSVLQFFTFSKDFFSSQIFKK